VSPEFQVRIAETRAAAKREKQINRLADLNVEIRRLQGRLAEKATQL